MRLGILSDTHLGHDRFYEESFKQAEDALKKLEALGVDAIIHAGDMFDTPFPSLNSLSRAYEIFKSVSTPVFAIAGNHERTSSDMVNPVKFLSKTGCFIHIHKKAKVLGSVALVGYDYIPDDKAGKALELVAKQNEEALSRADFKVLVIHQNIKDYSPGEGFTKSELLNSGFDLIINGHIHKRIAEWPILLPGSTLTTKINIDEIEPRSATVVDTDKKTVEKVLLDQRQFFYEVLNFDSAPASKVKEVLLQRYQKIKEKNPTAIVKFKLEGTLDDSSKGLILPRKKDLYIDNNLRQASIEEAMKELKKSFDEKKTVTAISEQQLAKELSSKVPEADELLLMLRDMDPEEIVERLLS